MQVVESIQKARAKGVDDKSILEEIRRQNPDKEVFFKKAEERGATATQIIEEILRQNQEKKEEEKPPSSPQTSSPERESPQKKEEILAGNKEGKTLLTKEAQEKEEEMRNQFLKRIEAKEKGESTGNDQAFAPTVSPEEATEMRDEEGSSLEEKKDPKIIILFVGAGVVVLLIFLFLLFNVL